MTFNKKSNRLEFEHCTQALKYFVERLLKKDIIKSANIKNKETYKKEIIELTHQFFCIKNPKKVIFNHRNYKTQPWWLISEILSETLNINPPIMTEYRSDIISWAYDLLPSGKVEYMYGGRWNEWNQLEYVYNLLKKNPTSKRAIIDIHTPYDNSSARKDVPCNCQYHFLLRNGKLNMTAIVRSWDITKGYKVDFSLYSFVLQSLASWLNSEIGNLYVYVSSLHCYSQDIEKLKKLKLYLNYHENDILELEIDKNMEIGKTYEDLRKVREIETLIRNGIWKTNLKFIDLKINNLNYKFARDFCRIYLLKALNRIDLNDKYVNEMETKCKEWCK